MITMTTSNGEGRRPSRAGVILGLLMVALFIAVALSGDPVEASSRVALPMAVATLMAAGAVGVGAVASALLDRLSSKPRRTAPAAEKADLPVLLILGYPILGAILFLVSLASTSLPVLLAPVIAAAVAGTIVVTRTGKGPAAVNDEPGQRDVRAPKTLLVAVILLATATIVALLPAVSLDEVSYHLAIPKIWIGEGSAIDLPLMSHSYFPLGTESAAIPAIALLGTRGAVASHLVHLFIAIAAFIVAARALPRNGLAVLGLAAIATTPAIILAAGWSGTDVPLIAVSAVLFLSLDRFLREGEGLAIAVVATAAGLLVKYTFIPVAGVLFLCALVSAGANRARVFKAGVAGGVLGSLFFIRNLVLTGNPVEPFLSGGGAIARFRWTGSWGDTVVSYLFDTRFIDDSLGFILPGLALAALAIVRVIEPAWRRNVAIAMLLAAGLLTILGPSGRILLPFLVLPAWIALAALVTRKETVGRVVAGILLIVASLLQLGVSWLHLDKLDPLAVVSGNVADSEWVARHRRSQALVDQGNRLLDPSRRTLVLGVNELFWYEGRVAGVANFDSERVSAYLSGTPDEVLARLREDAIESILVYPQLMAGSSNEESIEDQRSLELTPEASSNLLGILERHAALTSRERNALLYDLK